VELKKTGAIWKLRPRVRAQIIRRICESLQADYGRPRLGNPKKTLDDLIFIIVSNRTTPYVADQAYRRLCERFKSWDDVLESSPRTLRTLLKPAGLSIKKSKQIRSLLKKVHRDFGRCSLDALRNWDDVEIHSYLLQLSGVSDKVAKCVMLYTLSSEVLPVDVHVYRVSKRLGLTDRNRAAQTHEELEALIPPTRRYAFHVDCIAHGRSTCKSIPDCHRCNIRRYCQYFKSVK
jgi:endonuclease III